MEVKLGTAYPFPLSQPQYKRRKISLDANSTSLSRQTLSSVGSVLPVLKSSDYFSEPCLSELTIREFINPGYCSRVLDFTVGRYDFGCIRFVGETDIRCLDLDEIVKFRRHEVVVYEDEDVKPAVGVGLNKAAEVTLLVQTGISGDKSENHSKRTVEKLRLITERQGAKFISFNPSNGEWKFLVQHFSRFGLSDDDEEDITMDDVLPEVQDPVEMDGADTSDIDDGMALVEPTLLAHSLPAHLGLDPVKMKEMKWLMSPEEEEEVEESYGMLSQQRQQSGKEFSRSPLQRSSLYATHRESPPLTRKIPLALIEYNNASFGSSSPGSILMTKQDKGALLRTTKSEGFRLDLKQQTPITGNHSWNIVDAALFMGRSFRVGWGPNGVLVHSGKPVGSSDTQCTLSSVINLEKVAIDRVARDESNKVRKELVDFCFDSPLNLHNEMSHETRGVEVGSFKFKLKKVFCNRLMLSDICRSHIGIVEKQLEVPGLSSVSRVLLMHQVMVWELIKVLFSSRQMHKEKESGEDDQEEDMIRDGKESFPDVDPESLPLIRRAEFSYWLQESVYHRVQEEVSSLGDTSDLEHIFLLLTGRQLDAAVELAASRGDVRLACLLSQAGGSVINRSDIAKQLDIWRENGMDFSFIEGSRIRLLELLSGNIHESLCGIKIDWKRFLGLLMWYQLSPDTPLQVTFYAYQQLLDAGKAPYPVPVYIDEGPAEESESWQVGDRFDLAYYLMLLHSKEGTVYSFLKTMFSAFASTNDPLDHHMIWHQRAVLEAIGVFSSDDLHALDMGFVSQLLCLGQCHWAIYVVLHIPYRDDYPYMHATIIREILFQYCQDWSSQESQWKFIENLGIPSEWLHEALATYFNYYGDFAKALEHFLECGNWQKAHSIFMTSVAHSLFLSAKHSEIWRLITSMEDHKSEIEEWDLGAGMYISFFTLRTSLQENSTAMTEPGALEDKKDACSDFISRLNKSLAIWSAKLPIVPIEARVAYSTMAEEICTLLVSDSNEDSKREVQLSCFSTIFKAPLPEDLRSCHLQDAVSLFTCYITEAAS